MRLQPWSSELGQGSQVGSLRKDDSVDMAVEGDMRLAASIKAADSCLQEVDMGKNYAAGLPIGLGEDNDCVRFSMEICAVDTAGAHSRLLDRDILNRRIAT